MDNSKLSSYQNPEGTLKDRLVPRTNKRLDIFAESFDDGWLNKKSVLDLGCNNGYFVRYALKHKASRAVGVDISDCIDGAKELAKNEGYNKAEFWQVNMESKEFQRFCPKFDVVFLLSSLAKVKDKDRFLNWLDGVVVERLVFESNHGEVHKNDIELVKKHIYFKKIKYLGPSEIPEKPHYMWDCWRPSHEIRYPFIKNIPVEFIRTSDVTGWDMTSIYKQKTVYDLKSDEYKNLKEDIRQRGFREPIIVTYHDGDKYYKGFQGLHRYFTAIDLKYKYIPVKVIRNSFFKHLGEYEK